MEYAIGSAIGAVIVIAATRWVFPPSSLVAIRDRQIRRLSYLHDYSHARQKEKEALLTKPVYGAYDSERVNEINIELNDVLREVREISQLPYHKVYGLKRDLPKFSR